MNRALVTCLALLLAGCLGDLVKPPGEDGGPGGGSADAAVPTDIDIRLATLVVDLDLDDFPDLVLLNDAPIAGERGVRVYFDKESGFLDQPDQVLSTESLHPLVATTGDFVGGGLLDLMVVARDDDDVPYLVLFEQDSQRSFIRAASTGFPDLSIGGGSVSMPEPVFAARTYIRESMAAVPGLVFGDLDMAVTLSITDWSAVSAIDDRPLATGSSTMNLAIPVPSAQPDRNDLLVLDKQGGIWLKNAGATPGDFGDAVDFPQRWAAHPRTFFVFDVQGDETPDFMTLDGSDLHVVQVTWVTDELGLTVRLLDPSPALPDGRGDALFATDIDGNAAMDLLILDDVQPPAADASHFGLLAAANVQTVDDGTISPANGRVDADRRHLGDPTRLVAGDFDRDGDVEVWVFDETLDFAMCLRPETYETDKIRFNECP